MVNKRLCLLQRELLQRDMHFDALIEGLKSRFSQPVDQVRLTDQDEESRRQRIKIEIGEQLDFKEVFSFKEVGIIKDDNEDFFPRWPVA